jgi:hypothetical protein
VRPGKRPADQPSFSAWAASAAQTCLTAGKRNSATRRGAAQCGQRHRGRWLSCSTIQPNGAELVIKKKRRQFDGDVGNSGRNGLKAAAERVEIGQSAALSSSSRATVEDGDCLGQAGTVGPKPIAIAELDAATAEAI